MNCPHCKTDAKLHVRETRAAQDSIVRRRCCDNCGKHFGTREQIDLTIPMNVRKPKQVRKVVMPKSNKLYEVWK